MAEEDGVRGYAFCVIKEVSNNNIKQNNYENEKNNNVNFAETKESSQTTRKFQHTEVVIIQIT